MIKPDKCIHCGKCPSIMDFGDIVYTQCSCRKWSPYEFCGTRPDSSVRQWNLANAHVPGKKGPGRGIKR